MEFREFKMTNYVSSLVAQIGVGFFAFAVSAGCILAAVGPVHFVA